MPYPTYCRICKSPIRSDIDKLLDKNVPATEVALAVAKYFPAVAEVNLYQSILVHKNKKHPPLPSDIKLDTITFEKEVPEPVQESISIEPEKPQTIDDYFDQILKQGFSPEVMRKLSPAQIIQAQKIIYERTKTKEQNTLLMDILKSMMSGLVTEEDEQRVLTIEREIANESTGNTL